MPSRNIYTPLDCRSSGVLLHLTSLPNQGFIGTLGREALKFCDILSQNHQSWWQMLPINPLGDGYSPYSSISAMAAEPLLIDTREWLLEGWIKPRDLLATKTKNSSKTEYAKAYEFKPKIWRHAAQNFFSHGTPQQKRSFETFKRKQQHWLDDFTLFSAIARKWGTNWQGWPKDLKNRDSNALKISREHLKDEIDFYGFLQWQFEQQWRQLRRKAKSTGVGLIGDLPIFISHGSCDVWANQKLFLLKKDGSPSHVAGCPPDIFNKNGQLWGNALYRWPALETQKYRWWIKRFERLFELFDVVRIDHFIGLHHYWKIPAGSNTAKSGHWERASGDKMLRSVIAKFGDHRLIAEDLGLMTPAVHTLRQKHKIPGTRVLQFAFSTGQGAKAHQPQAIDEDMIAYTGTHDNPTLVGWLKSVKRTRTQQPFDRTKINVALGTGLDLQIDNSLRLIAFSSAKVVIIPAQDILKLDDRARMNVPGTSRGNWTWRLMALPTKAQLKYLRSLTTSSDRAP
jgi:4-alpha-glucanotransferase